MLKFFLALFPFASLGAIAAPIDFTGKPVLVQQLALDGSITSQFIDILLLNPATQQFEPQSTFFGAAQFFGMCLSPENTKCSSSYKLADQFIKFMAVTNGRKSPDPRSLPTIPNIDAAAETKVVSENENSLTVTVGTKYMLATDFNETTFVIKKIPGLDKVQHRFMLPEQDEPNRKSISEIEDLLKTISTKVAKLETDIDSENMVGGGGRSHGTGYFISPDGIMMTNHHVIDSFSECMKKFICDVNFSQVTADGKRIEFRTKVSLLAMSSIHDFALIKVKMPTDVPTDYFEIEKEQVGPHLITLGYPGDLADQNDHKTRLTYSFGRLVAFHGQTYATSNYIFGGASGSPLLNAETLKVVGILSNGAGNPIAGVGSPGLARPFYLIDAEFGISSYLDGKKQNTIKSILKKINASQSAIEVIPLLQQFQAEKTFYGVVALKALMVNHQVKEVRKEIARSLQSMAILIGGKI